MGFVEMLMLMLMGDIEQCRGIDIKYQDRSNSEEVLVSLRNLDQAPHTYYS